MNFPNGERKDTGTEMVAPPVVLLAASDGTVSFHYCGDPQIASVEDPLNPLVSKGDHDLPAPQRPERPRASGVPG